jgi:hypothetical protein
LSTRFPFDGAPPSIRYSEIPLAWLSTIRLLRIRELWTPSQLMPEPPPAPLFQMMLS